MALLRIQSTPLADHLHLEAIGHEQGTGLAALVHQRPGLDSLLGVDELVAARW